MGDRVYPLPDGRGSQVHFGDSQQWYEVEDCGLMRLSTAGWARNAVVTSARWVGTAARGELTD